MSAEEKQEQQAQKAPKEEEHDVKSSRQETDEQQPGKEEHSIWENIPDIPEDQDEENASDAPTGVEKKREEGGESEGKGEQEAGGEKEEKAERKTGAWEATAGTTGINETEPDDEDPDQVEEVILDEAGLDEENPPEADSSPLESERAEEERSAEGNSSSGKQVQRPFFRRKRVMVVAMGLFIVAGLAVLFFERNSGKALNFEALLGGKGKEAQSLVETVLKPFFVPLPADAENAAVRLVIAVKWPPEILARYRRKPAPIRNDVYQHLLRVAGSGRDMVEQKAALVSELNSLFQHALAVKNVEVRLDEIAPI